MPRPGVLVGGVIADSPAAKARTEGRRPHHALQRHGNRRLQRAGGHSRFQPHAVGSSGGCRSSRSKGVRDGKPISWKVTTTEREPAEPREKELLSWGITARDLTDLAAKQLLRADSKAVVVQSLRPGGAAAASKPSIDEGDLILVGGWQADAGSRRAGQRQPGNHRRKNRARPRARLL